MTFTDEQILSTLPDVESAQRFLTRFEEKHARDFKKLTTNRSLLSDVLAIVSLSDFLAATLLENPQYLSWLDKRRRDSGVRSKEELLESCAQFRSTNMSLEANALYEKFRRRELLRIFLRDIRRLATIAEITEEISNLADSILESAIATACAEVDNRFGRPQEEDAKGKARSASFCIVALGKLGSRELNYSSDIDLLFLYSGEGKTRGGSRESVTNREYFVKLAELIIKLIGQSTAAPSAYRVDMRLRPHGSLGALAMSVEDTALLRKRRSSVGTPSPDPFACSGRRSTSLHKIDQSSRASCILKRRDSGASSRRNSRGEGENRSEKRERFCIRR